MFLVIAAICFIVLEIFKLYHNKTLTDVSKDIWAGVEFEDQSPAGRHLMASIVFPAVIYFAVTVYMCVIPGWQITAFGLFGICFCRAFLPTTRMVNIVDGIASIALLLYGVIVNFNPEVKPPNVLL